MRKLQSIILESHTIAEILKFSPTKKYQIDAPLFYEGHTPIVAFLLVEGSIQLFKNKKPKKLIKPGSLIGYIELMNNTPAELSARVMADSLVCFLDKSTIQEILRRKNCPVSSALTESDVLKPSTI